MSGDDATRGPSVPEWGRGHDATLAYHARLLRDPLRLDAYDRAIRALVRPGDVVLDLGSGTGVLAMLAARAGAARVHAIESMPVAELSRHLIAANGLADIVKVHRADATRMEPVEPVDVVVSEFMGRFVVDDGMLWAVEASGGWLKPTARWCPQQVDMKVAPVAIGDHESLDAFESPVVGLDLSAAAAWAHRADYGLRLAADALLSDALTHTTLRPPAVPSCFDTTLEWTFARDGRLRGVAGWFEALLTDDVHLSTAPGRATHWGQMLLPLPAMHVAAGATLRLRLWREDDEAGRLIWRWSGDVDGAPVAGATDQRLDAATPPAAGPPLARGHGLDRAEVEDLNEAGAEAFEAGDLVAARGHFAAAVCALRTDMADLAGDYHENLGLTLAQLGRHRAAIGPLLRALDGDWTSREQSARFLVDAWFRTGQGWEGERALRRYEEAFGDHPAGWRRR